MLAKESKIMIVDDMKMIRTALKQYLEQLGYQNTIEASNGQEAVELFDNESPDFIFMDIVMPVMTGDQALTEIRKKDKQTPIVMLTSVAEEGMVKECVSAGITGYALKPLNAENGPQVLSDFLNKA